MDYLPTLGKKWPHSRGNVGKYSLHGSYGNPIYKPWSSAIWKGNNRILRGRKLTWLLTTYKSWDDPPSMGFLRGTMGVLLDL